MKKDTYISYGTLLFNDRTRVNLVTSSTALNFLIAEYMINLVILPPALDFLMMG